MLRMREMAFRASNFKNFLGETPPDPSIHAWYVGHTCDLQPMLPPLKDYLTERSLFKKCPRTGKSLKKALRPGEK